MPNGHFYFHLLLHTSRLLFLLFLKEYVEVIWNKMTNNFSLSGTMDVTILGHL